MKLTFKSRQIIFYLSLTIILLISIVFAILYWHNYNKIEPYPQFCLAISGSLFASFIFTILIKFYDDFKKSEETYIQEMKIKKIIEDIEHVKENVEILCDDNLSKNVIVHLVKTPKEKISKLLNGNKTRTTHFTAMGINLHSLHDPFIKSILKKENSKLHILLPAVDSPLLREHCNREGRSYEQVKDEINSLCEDLRNTKTNTEIEIKLTDSPSNVTIVRIGDVIFWRPRMQMEYIKEDSFCFEVNKKSSPFVYEILRGELATSWDNTPIHYSNPSKSK